MKSFFKPNSAAFDKVSFGNLFTTVYMGYFIIFALDISLCTILTIKKTTHTHRFTCTRIILNY